MLLISTIILRKLFVLVTSLLYGAREYLRSAVEGNTSVTILIQIQSVIVMTYFNVRSRSKSKKKKTKHEKLERIDELVDELKLKHGTTYTNIQYRVWAETIDAQNHSSTDSLLLAHFSKVREENNQIHLHLAYAHPSTSTPLTPRKLLS